jgi:hypothetical protein
MFDKTFVKNYILPISLVLLAQMFSKQIKGYLKTADDVSDYELVREYLLNDFPLYGKSRPIIWIHSEYEVNSRKWQSYQSRNTMEINQPYLIECVQSVINMCGNDFNICLIDDESFHKLIPNWNIDMKTFSEPIKKQYRLLALLKLVHIYGGVQIPNNFLCTSNLSSMIQPYFDSNRLFAIENSNSGVDLMHYTNQPRFMPSCEFIGSTKENPVLLNVINDLEKLFENGHYTLEYEFKGNVSHTLHKLSNSNSMDVIDGRLIGVKDTNNKPILLDDLMAESYLNIDEKAYGILIPKRELLKRTKYQWFAVATPEQIYDATCILTQYFKISAINHAEAGNTIKPVVTSI